MKKFIIILLISISFCNDELDSIIFSQFQKFIKKFNKKYSSINEYFTRFQIFKNNVIETFSKEETSYKTGITRFFDLTRQEFNKKYSKLIYNSLPSTNFESFIINNKNEAPPEFDWRDKNVVTPVGDQLECGSYYAFSAIGNLEGLYAINKNILKQFSIQMIIDCDTYDASCNGGIMEYVFNWIKDNGGINYEEDYPFNGYKRSCRKIKEKYSDMKILGYKILGKQTPTWWAIADENDMKEFLYQNGPLSVVFNNYPLYNYVSGIIDVAEEKCPINEINHSGLLVGYGTDSNTGLDYWIVKNSWGTYWGDKGYFKIRRGNSTCGINYYVISAVVRFDN